MNDNEVLYLKWLEKQKKAEGLRSISYSTTDGDTASEEFFAEANDMNAAEAVEVEAYSENFPRYELLEPLVDVALHAAIAAGRAKKLVFNDRTGIKIKASKMVFKNCACIKDTNK